jgi:hypothetical protein
MITADVQRVFDHLDTADFELVLRMLWHASRINQALEIPDDRTTQAYVSVRDALIGVVHATHVSHDAVRPRLPAAAAFMSRFSTVLSLSYDLLVYWAILVGKAGREHYASLRQRGHVAAEACGNPPQPIPLHRV